MTLLEDIQSIDLSSIVEARGSIRASVNSPELQSIVQSGAVQSALADLGSSIGSLQQNFQSPADFLRPLADVFEQLSGSIQIEDLPIGQLREAVEQGATIIGSLVEGLDENPLAVTKLLNLRVEGAANLVQDLLQSYTRMGVGELSAFKQLLDLVERGVPSNPAAFADLAVDALMPFPSAGLREIRLGVDTILNGAALIQLPDTRTAGLLLALEGVERTALTGQIPALQSALRELERVRQHTLGSIRDDLRSYMAKVDQLQIEGLLLPLMEASRALNFATEGVLEFMQLIKTQVAAARGVVQAMDASQVGEALDQLLDWIETTAQTHIVEPIEAAVESLKLWLRSLLHQIPLFELRTELSNWLHGIAQTIRDADLDGPAESVRQVLADLQKTLSPANLTAEVQAALGSAGEAIDQALDGVLGALEQIATAVESVAGQAQGVLTRATQALAEFKVMLDELTVSLENLGIQEAGQQVVDTIRDLRETAEALLSELPLPDALRPLVEQLIETLESVDFEEIMEPVEQTVAEFRIPPEVAETIQEGLRAVKDALDNLIPDQLIQSIQEEIDAAFQTLRDFDPSSLLSGVTEFLDSAAEFVEGLDPAEYIQILQEPFDTVLVAFDRANPRRLLQPVLDAYDELLGNIRLPTPEVGVQRFNEALSSAGANLAKSIVAPLQNIAPPEATLTPPGSPPPIPTESSPPPEETIRPGDIIRLFGFIPMKLREALSEMEASQAGEVLRAIDELTGGLARDIRRVQAAVYALEDRLNSGLDGLFTPLTTAQLRAQMAIQANFQVGALDMEASLSAVALAGPGTLRSELSDSLRQTVGAVQRSASTAGGTTGSALERLATALESCSLARLATDLDTLLAALDPEPIAAEIDAFVHAVLQRAPQLLADVQKKLGQAMKHLTGLIAEYNPLIQAQKFLRVLDVLSEELERLSPHSLVAELGELHTALRDVLLAYNPQVFAEDLSALIATITADLRALDPATLLGDLSSFNDILDRLEAASPVKALEGIGTQLEEVGAQLVELDPGAMLDAVSDLGPELIATFRLMVNGIRDEIVALLRSLNYAVTNASVSASGTVG